MNVTQQYISTSESFCFVWSIIHRYNLGYFNATATTQQGLDIVHVLDPSDSEDSYINLVYDNVGLNGLD